jgi:hypothetical protein
MHPTPREERPAAADAVPEWIVWCDREIRRQPLNALTVAAAAGFILGGGLKTRIGRGLVLVTGRSLIRSAMYGFIAGLVKDDANRHNGTASRRTGSGAR